MLTNCNQLSINRLKSAGVEFKKHTVLLAEMKKDLDYIFKKIRNVRHKLNQQYPQAFNGMLNKRKTYFSNIISYWDQKLIKLKHMILFRGCKKQFGRGSIS